MFFFIKYISIWDLYIEHYAQKRIFYSITRFCKHVESLYYIKLGVVLYLCPLKFVGKIYLECFGFKNGFLIIMAIPRVDRICDY